MLKRNTQARSGDALRQRRDGHGPGAGERGVSHEPTFRVAVESDSATLLAFMRDYYAFDGHGFDEKNTPIALIALLRDSNLGRVWLILDDGTPVGYLALCFGYSLEWLGRDAFVDELYLREEYRGRGWGSKAMVFAEEQARSLGVTTLHLGVVEGNTVALKVYERLGFKKHSSTFLSKWIARGWSKPAGRNGY